MKQKEFGVRQEGITYILRPGVYGLGFRQVSEMVNGVINKENIQIAIIHTPRGRFLPGGGIEEGENHNQCLSREFIEESGYKIDIEDFIGKASEVGLTPRTKRYVELQGHFYLVSILEHGEGQVEEDHELIWIDVDEAISSLRLDCQSYAVSEGFKIYIGI